MSDKETEKPGTPKDTEEGIQPKTTGLIDGANNAAERLEKANEEKARLLSREEELEARKRLGGTSDAGQLKLTVEEEKNAEAKKLADEMTNAFK